MTMTSLLWRHLYLERSQSVQYFAQQFSVATRSVEEHSELNTTSEQVQQANMFKRQTLMFRFSRYRPNSCKYLSHHTPVWPHERIDRCDRCIGCWNHSATRFLLIHNTVSTMSKLFTPNMYYWSCEILVTIYWTHLRLNGICTKSFCPEQTNNWQLILRTKSPTKCIFRNFHSLKINSMMPFCNLLMEWPSYLCKVKAILSMLFADWF